MARLGRAQAFPPRLGKPAQQVAGEHTTTGALASDAATVAGTATHLTLHTTTGALTAQDATIAGVAAHEHAATGALASDAASIAGTAAHEHAITGSLVSADAAISGSAAHTAPGVHASSGALASDDATVAGTAAHLTLHVTTGSLLAQDAQIVGVSQGSVISRRGLGVPRRNYIYKGRRYFQITYDELARIIASDIIEVSRDDIKVTYKNKKPHKIAKEAFESLLDTVSKLPKPPVVELFDDDQDIEDILALL